MQSRYIRNRLFAENFLVRIREYVKKNKMNTARLPSWIESSKIKYGKINNSNILVFEPSKKNDIFRDAGNIVSDSQLFFNLKPFKPTGAVLDISSEKKDAGSILHKGSFTDEGGVIFNIRIKNDSIPAIYNVGYTKYHMPFATMDFFYQISSGDEILNMRFLPLVLYIHDLDYSNFELYWEKAKPHFYNQLHIIENSEEGDYYETLYENRTSFYMKKENTVTVFGKYNENKMNLFNMRDYQVKKLPIILDR